MQQRRRKPMRQINRILFLVALFIVAFIIGAGIASAQTVQPTPPPTAQTESDLKECAQMLNQQITETRSCARALTDAETSAAAEKTAKEKAFERIKTFEENEILFQKRIKYLESIKCSEVKILFIYKRRFCN